MTQESRSRDTIATVTGAASAEAEPDRVRLHLQVQAAEASAKAATEAFAVALAGARALLDEAGCTYSVGSVSSWTAGKEQERRSRHQVSAQLVATVEDLGTLPGLVEKVLDTERLSVGHLQWELSNVRELRRQARVKAIAEAREAAEDYAAALGLRLGQVLSVSDPEHGGGMHPMAKFARAEMAMDRPEMDLSNTEPVRVEGSVVVSFLLEDVLEDVLEGADVG